MKKIILASQSPRRKELLELLNIPFVVHPSNIEEVVNEESYPFQVVESLALQKANDVASNYHNGIIIGTDTIVVYEHNILGKPKDENDAFEMLKLLQGQAHEVYSGLAIIDADTGKSIVSHRVTKVFMYPLSDDDIVFYLNTKEPLDKAGSYGIQGVGSIFIEKIEGDYFNVVGLPLSLLRKQLLEFGVNITRDLIRS